MRDIKEILDNLTQGIVIIEEDYNISYVNSKAEEIFNKKIPTGVKCYKFFHSSNEPCNICPIKNGNFNTIIYHNELGSQYNCIITKVNNYYIKEVFDYKKFFNIFESYIEEQKFAEVGHISAAIAHHVNNLLMGISGRIEAISMLKDEKKLTDEYFYKVINKITENINAIKKLMDEILYFAHPERIRKKKIDINNVIRDFYLLSKYEIERPNVKLILDLKDNLPDFLGEEKLIIHLVLVICRILSKNFYNIEKQNKIIKITTDYDEEFIVIRIKDNNHVKCEKITKIIKEREINYDNYVIRYCLLFHKGEIYYEFDEGNLIIVKLRYE